MKTILKWALILALMFCIYLSTEVAKAADLEATAHVLNVLDVVTTKMALDDGGYEQNKLYGKHPDDKRLIAILLLKTAVVRGVNYYAEDNTAYHFNLGWTMVTGPVVIWNATLQF